MLQHTGLARLAAQRLTPVRVQQHRCQLSRRSVIRCVASEAAAAAVHEAAKQKSAVPTSDVLELDFCSRPLLDERGKKVWELLVCNSDRSFEFSQYFPNSKINSVEVSWVRLYAITATVYSLHHQ